MDLKKDIAYANPLFLKIHSFHYVNWEPNFDPWKYTIKKTPIWLKVVDLPSEYWSLEALIKIGDALGVFLGVDMDFIDGKKRSKSKYPCGNCRSGDLQKSGNTLRVWKLEIESGNM